MANLLELSEYLYRENGGAFFTLGVPSDLLNISLLIFVVAFVLFAICKRNPRSIVRFCAFIALIEFVFILYCSTVVFRSGNSVVGYSLEPFWSYQAIANGKTELILENILNVLVFIPVGFLCGLFFKANKIWKAIAVGMITSIVIEVSQIYFKKGFAEFDDLIHNTFGCIIGFQICYLCLKACRYFTNFYK